MPARSTTEPAAFWSVWINNRLQWRVDTSAVLIRVFKVRSQLSATSSPKPDWVWSVPSESSCCPLWCHRGLRRIFSFGSLLTGMKHTFPWTNIQTYILGNLCSARRGHTAAPAPAGRVGPPDRHRHAEVQQDASGLPQLHRDHSWAGRLAGGCRQRQDGESILGRIIAPQTSMCITA